MIALIVQNVLSENFVVHDAIMELDLIINELLFHPTWKKHQTISIYPKRNEKNLNSLWTMLFIIITNLCPTSNQ